MSRAEALAAGRGYLRNSQVEATNEDARLLLLDACGVDPVALVTDGGRPLTEPEADRFATSLDRRAAGEPTSRIIGRRPFWSLDLAVRAGVLDPRADSEALVRLAVRIANRSGAPPRRILDLGCGSGALLCALLSEFDGAYGVGVDLSAEACAASQANIAKCGFGDRAAVLRASWCEALTGSFDLVVSNPPYIRAADIAGLDREVRDHDPPLALDGGEDGLDAYRALFAAVPRILSPGGAFAVEFGFRQEGDVARLAAVGGLRKIDSERDFSGRDRASAFAVV